MYTKSHVTVIVKYKLIYWNSAVVGMDPKWELPMYTANKNPVNMLSSVRAFYVVWKFESILPVAI